MVHIKITKGLDIPVKGKPNGEVRVLYSSSESASSSGHSFPRYIGLDLSSFDDVKFRVAVKEGDSVKLGQPLLEDKECSGRYFVSPAGGTVREIRRGLKRRLLDVVIEVSAKEEIEHGPPIDLRSISRKELVERMKHAGLFTRIRQRPFNLLADPEKTPRNIFVKAIESAPFTPPAELQVAGYEKEFQEGLNALAKLTDGAVHLVYRNTTTCRAFLDASTVEKHTAEGPHPVSNPSVHIERIDPVRGPEDVVWTLDAREVTAIGFFLMHGHSFVSRIVGLGGPSVVERDVGYYRLRDGYPVSALISGKIDKGPVRIVSGNLLTGRQVEDEDFLGFDDTVVCAVPENTKRKFLHFLRFGTKEYSYSGAYATDRSKKEYAFTTSQHGEKRPFIDATLYDDVMPLQIATMPLVKAVLAEDYDLATELGLLEVSGEDFALAGFVCPSKVEMGQIIDAGLKKYAVDMLK